MWSNKVYGWLDEFETFLLAEMQKPILGDFHVEPPQTFLVWESCRAKTDKQGRPMKGATMNPEWMGGDPFTAKHGSQSWIEWIDEPNDKAYSNWRVLARSTKTGSILTFVESPSGTKRAIYRQTKVNAEPGIIWEGADKVLGQSTWDSLHRKAAGEVDNNTLVRRLGEHVKDFYAAVKCPGCTSAPSRLYDVVQHLNDNHMWTRERIADWLETLDLDLTVHQEPVSHATTPQPKPIKMKPKAKPMHSGGHLSLNDAMTFDTDMPLTEDQVKAILGIEPLPMLADNMTAPKVTPHMSVKGVAVEDLFDQAKLAEMGEAVKALTLAMQDLVAPVAEAFKGLFEAINTPAMKEVLANLESINTEKKEQD